MDEKVMVAPKGLDGVVVDTTKISKVNAETNSLLYCGYPVQDLAENCTFEEVAYLLWNGNLPTEAQLREFERKERNLRDIDPALVSIITSFSPDAHPMDTIRTCVSYIGAQDPRTPYSDTQSNIEKAFHLLAKIPTCIAYTERIKNGQLPIAPRHDLSISENFFHMCFGRVPSKEEVKCFDVSLILYAEHSFNASTFTARVITSSQSDLYSAVTGAIGSLKGPLHGGANEAVMHMMLEIGDPKKAREWMLTALKEKRKIMGFGHRVYKSGDSRVPTMKKYFAKMSEIRNEFTWLQMYEDLEKTMVEQKDIYPNLDFPTGPAYFMMGFDIEAFTPIFVMSRITGWTAHIIEQTNNNRLIRPLSEYNGESQRKLIPLSDRGR